MGKNSPAMQDPGVQSQVVLVVKNPPTNAGDTRDVSSVPGMERSPGEGSGSQLQCSCLENPMGRGARAGAGGSGAGMLQFTGSQSPTPLSH